MLQQSEDTIWDYHMGNIEGRWHHKENRDHCWKIELKLNRKCENVYLVATLMGPSLWIETKPKFKLQVKTYDYHSDVTQNSIRI